ncbi:DUF4221 family protein [Cyclobacterium sp. 1_MG-2023]|uniref:DUF4221 family protein n=1 Tax=Cyclobacterium sp. 1_MG-2023 TaxID=3062681 RepID=UPI0026E26413|nr:DUF4221 family protein [Cyclobacterium sp. 1_MG-2023]MDO6439237.1 DUF4221 family protein [Cyclobacterium sp. 1_MG-2023]
MRLLYIGIAIASLFSSCSKNTEKENEFPEQLSFSLDTVYVDPGDEILYLQDKLYLSDLSADKSYLINFNRKDLIAERINLDELKLEKLIPFEKEGPNGTPTYFSRFSLNDEEQLLIWSYQFYSIFDQNAKKIKDLGLEKIAADYLSGSDFYPLMLFEDPEQPERVLGVFISWKDRAYFILDFDLKDKLFQKTGLPEMDKLQEYNTDILMDGQAMGSYGVAVHSIAINGKIILTNNSFNEVVIYDTNRDSTYVKSWDTPLLGTRKNYTPPKQVDYSSGQREEVVRDSMEEINYGYLVWDETQKRFYRFSITQQFGEDKDEYGQYIATGTDVYLTIFDENLNILAESLVPQLAAPPNKHFVKDGKIWLFANMEDEMAFVQLAIE